VKIIDILKKQFTVSFEFFPPKTEEGEKELFLNIKKLSELNPSFVSVTYGAGGSTRDRTRKIVERIAQEESINVMAHLTCISHTKREILEILKDYRDANIHNILALRGDPQVGDPEPTKKSNEIPHASDLIKIIRDNFSDYFSIGGAVFVNRHPESSNWEKEIYYIKKKIDTGMEFGITQLFFKNDQFYEYLNILEKHGISIPIIPGIMPITSFAQIYKFSSMCNAEIPVELGEKLQKYKDDSDAVTKIGIEYAIEQCLDLLKSGINGLHFYTLNRSMATIRIYQAIKGEINR